MSSQCLNESATQRHSSGGAAEFSRLWISSAQNCVFMWLFFCFFSIFTSLFIRVTSAMIMYDKRTLLDIGQRYTNLIQDTLYTDPAWPLEILRSTAADKGRLNNTRSERNTAGNVLESATGWGKGLTALLYRVFCSPMSNPWIIRWTILEPGLVSNGTLETVTSFVWPKHGSLPRSRTML